MVIVDRSSIHQSASQSRIMADDESKSKISVTVKTPKDKHVVEVEEDASIKDVNNASVTFANFKCFL